jgi:hemerythrin-like metal-binding protein
MLVFNIFGVAMTAQRMVAKSWTTEVSVDVLSDVIAHWRETGELPPELLTGHRLIDFEHRFLVSSIANLQRVCIDYQTYADCQSCGQDRRAHCEGELIGLLGDVFAFILEHFKNEESIMRESLLLTVDREVCQAHMEDHAAIAAKVQEIVSSLDRSHTVSRIRELDALLARWMTNHIALHDMLLSRWISREDSLLRNF